MSTSRRTIGAATGLKPKTPVRVINLVSSDEEDSKPSIKIHVAATSARRKPLTPRATVPARTEPLTSTTASLGAARGCDACKVEVKSEPYTSLEARQLARTSRRSHVSVSVPAKQSEGEGVVQCDGVKVEHGQYTALVEHEDSKPNIQAPSSNQTPLKPILPPPPVLPSRRYRTPPPIQSESEDEFPPTRRTPWKGKARIVLNVESDDDSPVRPASALKGEPLDLSSGSEDDRSEDQPKGDLANALFGAGDSGNGSVCASEDEDEGEGEVGYDVAKHYDSSIGSLRDFIVDDSDLCDSGDPSSSESEPSLSSPQRKNVRPKGKGRAEADVEEIIYICDTDSESEPEAARRDKKEILHFSPPPRPFALPDLGSLTISSPPSTSRRPKPPPRTPSRGVETPASKRSAKSWEIERVRIAQAVFRELDKRVFESKLGHVDMEWNNRLLTTAGQARSKRTVRNGVKSEEIKIVLSEKVLTGEEQILSTVAHEMCHVACWVISNERKNPHGRVFKSWGRKVMKARPDIEVTTTHSYEIEYKYQWKCTDTRCGKIYQRHSKSIDIEAQGCGRCKSKLEPLFQTKCTTPFQLYLKSNMTHAKGAMPGASHGEVMRALSRQWHDAGPTADHAAHWAALAAAAR